MNESKSSTSAHPYPADRKPDGAGEKAAGLEEVTAGVQELAEETLEKLRALSEQARVFALDGKDKVEAYVRDEPIKGMLIAAATGALFMGLIVLVASSRD